MKGHGCGGVCGWMVKSSGWVGSGWVFVACGEVWGFLNWDVVCGGREAKRRCEYLLKKNERQGCHAIARLIPRLIHPSVLLCVLVLLELSAWA